ncbi:hypothetical protein VTK73DRAFT_5571 [Phialemonium thermophilum]|uniref:Uncharacterized protein n=1 Tax=Phialemonium thermophilum TaxID=223376 RepID=A0ABR3XY88_9PEZI
MASGSRKTNLLEVKNFVRNHHNTYPLLAPEKADLSGRSVFITGASKGIGRTTAVRFAMAGCSKIAVGARSPLAEVEKAVKEAAATAGRPQPQVLSLHLDVTSEASVRAAAEAVAEAFGGGLDILITNAGYLEKFAPVAETDPSEWWFSWDVNMKGTYLCARYFIPLLLRSSLRILVTMSSAGAHNLLPGGSAYQTAKFATCRFTEFVDQEYHAQGLLAFAVHPGSMLTELATNMPVELHGMLVDTPELSGDALVWLTKERREWLAGRYVDCCWDVAELEARKEEIVSKDLLKFRLAV